MTDISGEADCPRCGYHESYGCSCTSLEMADYWSDLCRALLARVEELESDRDELALAIMGGEDAPGFAAAQVTETLVQLVADNRRDAKAWGEHDGRLQGLDEAAAKVRLRGQSNTGAVHPASEADANAIEALKGPTS